MYLRMTRAETAAAIYVDIRASMRLSVRCCLEGDMLDRYGQNDFMYVCIHVTILSAWRRG